MHRSALALVALLAVPLAAPAAGLGRLAVMSRAGEPLNTEIEIAGAVKELVFVNPHSWLYFDVAGDDGRVTTWKCELRGATVLRRSGWSPAMFARGTRLTITGAPDRFEPNTCYLGTVVFDNGTRIDRYGQITQAAATAKPVKQPRRRPHLSRPSARSASTLPRWTTP